MVPFQVTQLTETNTNQSATYDFLLALHSNCSHSMDLLTSTSSNFVFDH